MKSWLSFDSMISCQLSVVGCRLSVVGRGQLTTENRELPLKSIIQRVAVITSLEELRAGSVLRGEAISMRVIEAPATVRGDSDEVLYIIEKDEGMHVPAGAEVRLEEKATVIGVSGGHPTGTSKIVCPPRVHLDDVPIQRTGDRWYRELIQSEITQFVGSIPPGRAPDHFHLYEEVLCVLQGTGFLWADGARTPIGRGSC